MSLEVKIRKVFNDVQCNHGSELRYCNKFSKIYEKSRHEEFTEHFLKCVNIGLGQSPKNLYAHQALSFAASFSVFLAQKAKKKAEELTPTSQETHRFLGEVIWQVLQKQSSQNHNIRYHVCYFIAVMLDIIGNDDLLDDHLCDYVQRLMLERLRDVKSHIRIKAIDTLFRLQDPKSPKCPVVAAFLECCRDPNTDVRKLIIEKIAPSKFTITTIIDSLSDICEKIRTAAFKKCSIIPPTTCLKITQRQEVLRKGFDEDGKIAKKAFIEVLFPKWLGHYEKNFLVFLTAVKLDADDKDLDNTTNLCCDIMKEIFKTHQIDDIVGYLPIDGNKLIPYESLSSEVILYWSMIHQHILTNNLDELLENIVPELSPFCEYIESTLSVFNDDKQEIFYWKELENQFITQTLFEMARNFDFSDEVGRNKLHDLVSNCLVQFPLKMSLLAVLIDILAKLNSSTDDFIEEVNELLTNISDLKNNPSFDNRIKCNEEIQKVRTKLNALSEELDGAIKQNDMSRAFVLEEELTVMKNLEAKLISEPFTCDPRRELVLDEKCLNILICLLKHESVRRATPTLMQMEERYVGGEMQESRKSPLYKKVFECCVLYSVNDIQCAKNYVELVSTPLNFYQEIEGDDEEMLLLSLHGVTDMLRIYGPQIFPEAPSNIEYFRINGQDQSYVKHLIEKIIDMLDDRRFKLRDGATKAITKIIYYGIAVTSTTFSRLLVKWYNPITQSINPLGQQLFGVAIQNYCQKFQESDSVVIGSVIPVLGSLSRITTNDINIDNLIKFLAAITQLRKIEHIHLHNVLSGKLCCKILDNVKAKAVELYVKMLMALEIPTQQNILDNLKLYIDQIIKALSDGTLKRKLTKYLQKLNNVHIKNETDVNVNDVKNGAPSQNSDSSPTETDTPDNYTIHDTDDSVGTPPTLKRNLSLRFLGSGEDKDLLVDAVDNASLLFQKKMRLEDDQINEIVENENQNVLKKRSTTEVQSVTPKKPKFEVNK